MRWEAYYCKNRYQNGGGFSEPPECEVDSEIGKTFAKGTCQSKELPQF